MKRRLLNLLTLLSLLLGAAILVLWVRSYRVPDGVERYVSQEYERADWSIADTFYSVDGRICWLHDRHSDDYGPALSESVQWSWFNPPPPERDFEPHRNPLTIVRELSQYATLGCATDLARDGAGLSDQWRVKDFYVIVPHWMLFLPAALIGSALPAGRLVRRLRAAQRRHARRCEACGYDLRTSPHRCPECGEAAPAVVGSASPAP
jgi:hypothetical protein